MFPGVDSESPAPRIRVDVSGPAFPIRETCVSVYFPEHRLYPESEGVSPVEPSERRGRASVVHKDVITMWKGLSIAQAHELDFWERTFQACIEDLIGGFLVFDLSRIHDTDGLPPIEILRRMRDFVNSTNERVFSLDISQVISSMLNRYTEYGKQHTWLSSSGNLRLALANLIRTKECFTDASSSCNLKVHLSAGVRMHGLCVHCEIAWVPPYLSFDHLETTVLEGSQCHVQPRFSEPPLCNEYSQYPFEYEHRLGCDDLQVTWDKGLQGFRCAIPTAYHSPCRFESLLNRPKYTSMDIQMVATKQFPEGVRFERTFRARIHLAVLGRWTAQDQHMFGQPLNHPSRPGILDVSNKDHRAGLSKDPKLSRRFDECLEDDHEPLWNPFWDPAQLRDSMVWGQSCVSRGNRTLSWYSSVIPARAQSPAFNQRPLGREQGSRVSSIKSWSAFEPVPGSFAPRSDRLAKRVASTSFETPRKTKRPTSDDTKDRLSFRKRVEHAGIKSDSHTKDKVKHEHKHSYTEELISGLEDGNSISSHDILKDRNRQPSISTDSEATCTTPSICGDAADIEFCTMLKGMLREPSTTKVRRSKPPQPPNRVDELLNRIQASPETRTPRCLRQESTFPSDNPNMDLGDDSELMSADHAPHERTEELLDQTKIQANYETFLEEKQEKELERLKKRLASQRGHYAVYASRDPDQEAFEAGFLEDEDTSELSLCSFGTAY